VAGLEPVLPAGWLCWRGGTTDHKHYTVSAGSGRIHQRER